MTVIELITRLSAMPPRARVVIPGHSGGYDDVSDIVLIEIVLGEMPLDYYGQHDRPTTNERADENACLIY